VQVGRKWGYIDRTGGVVMRGGRPPEHFIERTLKYGYIDRSGKYVWKPVYAYR
jgi:hypothetical protein